MRLRLITLTLILLFASPVFAFERFTATGSGAIDEAINFGFRDVYVTSVTLKLDGLCATSENLVIRNSTAGAEYYDADFNGEDAFVWNTKTPVAGYETETLDVEFTNTDANTWVLTVYYERHR